MSRLKKFWIVFLSFLPLSAGAIAPLAIGAIAGAVAVTGFSIYRSVSPVNLHDAFKFFSSCWSCGMFGDIFAILSGYLPKIYKSIGLVTIPLALGLTAVWVGWTILAGFIGIKKPDFDPYKDDNAALGLSGKMGGHLVKLALVCALLVAPLPRMISGAIVEPVFNIGLSISNATSGMAGAENEAAFETCLVATAVADPAARDSRAATTGAFSPKLRHNLTCQLGAIHQMTGLGMTAGWTMMNMAFDVKYMHTILFGIPIFPSIPLILAGGLILILFFFALLPIPMYFLEVIIKLSMNIVMLPLMLIGWLFTGWQIVPNGGKNIQKMVDELIQGTIGIAVVGVFVVFSAMFINAVFGQFNGVDVLRTAFEAQGTQGAEILMDGLLMNNDSMITIILLGIFIAMFMTFIPALIETLFQDVKIPQDYYKKVAGDAKTVWGNAQKWWKGLKK